MYGFLNALSYDSLTEIPKMSYNWLSYYWYDILLTLEWLSGVMEMIHVSLLNIPFIDLWIIKILSCVSYSQVIFTLFVGDFIVSDLWKAYNWHYLYHWEKKHYLTFYFLIKALFSLFLCQRVIVGNGKIVEELRMEW